MKRLIGTFMVSGLLASGAALAAASPSSAMPDNHCLDQQHYDQAYVETIDRAFTAYDDYQAWLNPEVFTEGSVSNSYIVSTSLGTEILPSVDMYLSGLHDAERMLERANDAVATFPDTHTVCDL